ncbi:MAG: S8 family serine peptidase, partial [Oscillospiraceae bacterium]
PSEQPPTEQSPTPSEQPPTEQSPTPSEQPPTEQSPTPSEQPPTEQPKTEPISAFSAEEPISSDYDLARLIVESTLSIDEFSVLNPARVIRVPLDNTYILQFETPAQALEAQKKLEAMPETVYVEPDKVIPLPDTIDEEYIPDNSIDILSAQTGKYSWGARTGGMREFAAMLDANTNKKEVIVAVIDTGLTSNDDIFTGRLKPGISCVKGNNDTSDVQSHGTHVAGIVADSTTDNIKIMPIAVFSINADNKLLASGTNIVAGIKYAQKQGAKVINLSLGASGEHIQSVERAIDEVVNGGVNVIVAAGNESQDIELSNACPAHVKSAITVASYNAGGAFSSGFSNYGVAVDITAPGGKVSSTIPTGNGVGTKSGTSMAAPHVAAAAAMIVSNNSSLSPAEVEAMIKNNANVPVGWDTTKYGAGLLDLTKLVSNQPTGSGITSINYKIDASRVMTGVLPKSTAATIKANVYLPTGTKIECYSASNAIVSDTATLGTGAKLVLKNSGGTVVDQVTIVVRGDNDGDGNVNINDLVAVKRHILGIESVKSYNFTASDTNSDGKVNINDLVAVKRHILGIESIVQ